MKTTPEQLHLAAAILETGHPFEYKPNEVFKWINAKENGPLHPVREGYEMRLLLATPPDNRPLHNPLGLTAEQVGVGYRLTLEGELPNIRVEAWTPDKPTWTGCVVKCGIPPGYEHDCFRVPLSTPWPEPPVRRKLGPQDIKPFMLIRRKGSEGWIMVSSAGPLEAWAGGSPLSYDLLEADFEYSLGPPHWQTCMALLRCSHTHRSSCRRMIPM